MITCTCTNYNDNDFYKGVVPATDFLKDSGIGMTDRGFIPVDKVM